MTEFKLTARFAARLESPTGDGSEVWSFITDAETLFQLSVALKAGYPDDSARKTVPCEPSSVWFASPPVVVSAAGAEAHGDEVTLRLDSASKVIDDSALYRTADARDKAEAEGTPLYLRAEVVISPEGSGAAEKVTAFRNAMPKTVRGKGQSAVALQSAGVDEMIGKTYGFLTVLRRATPNDDGYSSRNNLYCRCVCGKEVCCSSTYLKHGLIKSCGCAGKGEGLSALIAEGMPIPRLLRVDAMIGHQYGMLTVLRRSREGDKNYTNENNLYCRCACGTERAFSAYRLSKGLTISCGCVNRRRKYTEDLTGRRFGSWTVLGRAPDKEYKTSTISMWTCKCDCGTVRDVAQQGLLTGSSSSCGCRGNFAEGHGRISAGMRFGKLTTVERVEDYIGPHDKHYRRWKCRCDCGNEIVVKEYILNAGTRTACYSCQPKGAKGRKYENISQSPKALNEGEEH